MLGPRPEPLLPRCACRALARTGLLALLLTALLAGPLSVVPAQAYEAPPEGYAPYQPQTRCRQAVRPGTRELAAWVNRKFGGGAAKASLRPCRTGGTSEHKDGRAIDWSMDARKAAHRAEVRRFLDRLFAPDAAGNPHALARRMGVMYVIWNDHMYASYDRFATRDYRSSSCKRLRSCSATLRHRDHVHISLSRPGARAVTSWYTRGS